MSVIGVSQKFWSGRTKIGWSSPAKNGLYACAAFMSIVEAQQQMTLVRVVSKSKQQASDVLNETYTHEQEQERNRFVLNGAHPIYFGKESAMLLYTMYLDSSTLIERTQFERGLL